MAPLSVPLVSVGNRGRTGVDMFTHHLMAAVRALSCIIDVRRLRRKAAP